MRNSFNCPNDLLCGTLRQVLSANCKKKQICLIKESSELVCRCISSVGTEFLLLNATFLGQVRPNWPFPSYELPMTLNLFVSRTNFSRIRRANLLGILHYYH